MEKMKNERMWQDNVWEVEAGQGVAMHPESMSGKEWLRR